MPKYIFKLNLKTTNKTTSNSQSQNLKTLLGASSPNGRLSQFTDIINI